MCRQVWSMENFVCVYTLYFGLADSKAALGLDVPCRAIAVLASQLSEQVVCLRFTACRKMGTIQ